MSVACCLIATLAGEVGSAHAEVVVSTQIAYDETGRVRITVSSDVNHYYVLERRVPGRTGWKPVSMTLGEPGRTTLTESLGTRGIRDAYRVTRYPVETPNDLDGDGVDDVTEIRNPVALSPLNAARGIPRQDGTTSIPDHAVFTELAYDADTVFGDLTPPNLDAVKFIVFGEGSAYPSLLFINGTRYRSHLVFAAERGISARADGARLVLGEIAYLPQLAGPTGTPGVYGLGLQSNDSLPFEEVELIFELIAANMGMLRSNLAYYPAPGTPRDLYERQKDLYDNSRVQIMMSPGVVPWR